MYGLPPNTKETFPRTRVPSVDSALVTCYLGPGSSTLFAALQSTTLLQRSFFPLRGPSSSRLTKNEVQTREMPTDGGESGWIFLVMALMQICFSLLNFPGRLVSFVCGYRIHISEFAVHALDTSPNKFFLPSEVN